MASITSHLTPTERDELSAATHNLREYRAWAQDEQRRIRRLKNLAKKRAAKITTKVDAR